MAFFSRLMLLRWIRFFFWFSTDFIRLKLLQIFESIIVWSKFSLNTVANEYKSKLLEDKINYGNAFIQIIIKRCQLHFNYSAKLIFPWDHHQWAKENKSITTACMSYRLIFNVVQFKTIKKMFGRDEVICVCQVHKAKQTRPD